MSRKPITRTVDKQPLVKMFLGEYNRIVNKSELKRPTEEPPHKRRT